MLLFALVDGDSLGVEIPLENYPVPLARAQLVGTVQDDVVPGSILYDLRHNQGVQFDWGDRTWKLNYFHSCPPPCLTAQMINLYPGRKKINRNLNCCSAICHKFRKGKILWQHQKVWKDDLIFICYLIRTEIFNFLHILQWRYIWQRPGYCGDIWVVCFMIISYPVCWLPGGPQPRSVWSSREPEQNWRGGREAARIRGFQSGIVRWLLLPPSITTFLITGMVTSQRKFSISKVFSSFQKKTLCRCSPYMVFD